MRVDCGAAPKYPNKLLIEAGGASYRAINISAAAARRLLGLEVAPVNPGLPVPGDDGETEARSATRTRAAAASATRHSWDWLPLASSSFPRPDPYPISVGEPLDALQQQRIREDMLSGMMPV